MVRIARRDAPDDAAEILTFDKVRDPQVRESLSGPAFRLFLRVAEAWGLTVDERRILLGDLARPTYHKWRSGRVGTLGRDQIERVSLVLGIHKGLRLLFADADGARRWLVGANRDVPFGGVSPLARMLGGSIDDLYTVRRYIDAWRGMA